MLVTVLAFAVTAGFVICDCGGNRFFDGTNTQTEPRNRAMIPQQQVDSVAFATGSILAPAPTPSPAASPGTY